MSVVPKLRWNRLPDGVIRLAYGHDAHDGEQPRAADGFLLVLATGADDDAMRLRAGEALSHLLLSATALGLPSCALTEPMTDMRDRMALACGSHAEAYPQALIRLGSAPTDTTQPPVTAPPLGRRDDGLDGVTRARSISPTGSPSGAMSPSKLSGLSIDPRIGRQQG